MKAVDAQCHNFCVSLVEFATKLGNCAEFSSTTGVKSAGCGDNTPHESPSHLLKLDLSFRCSASKSGATSPNLISHDFDYLELSKYMKSIES